MSSRKEYSIDFRQRVVSKHSSGYGYKRIASMLEMPVSSVQSIIAKWKMTNSVSTLPRSGRPRKTCTRTDRLVVRKVMTNRRLSASDLANDLKDSHTADVTPQTIRNRIHDAGLAGRAARKKPFLSPANKKKRLLQWPSKLRAHTLIKILREESVTTI